MNFHSLLSVPIVHNDKVLAVINADANQTAFFDEQKVKRLQAIARQVAKPISDRRRILDALAQIGVELARSPRDGGLEDVLQRIAALAVQSLGADVVTVYPYIQEKDEFPVVGTGPLIGGNIKDPQPMRRKVFKGDVPWTVVKERKSGFYSDVHNHSFLTGVVDRPGDPPRPRFIDREEIKSMAALLLPFRAAEDETEEVVGVMFANYRTRHDFNIDEISALASFADYAAAAILNARHEEQQRRSDRMKMVETIGCSRAIPWKTRGKQGFQRPKTCTLTCETPRNVKPRLCRGAGSRAFS